MHAQCSSSGGDTACLAYDNWQMGVKIKIQKYQICCNSTVMRCKPLLTGEYDHKMIYDHHGLLYSSDFQTQNGTKIASSLISVF